MSTDTPIWMGAKHTGATSSLNERNRLAYEAGATPADLLMLNERMVWSMAHRHYRRVGSPEGLIDDYKQGAAEGFLYYFKRDPKRWDPDKGTLGTAVGYTIISHLQKHVDSKQRHAIALPQGVVGGLTEEAMELAEPGAKHTIPKITSLDAKVRNDKSDGAEHVDMIPDAGTEGQAERFIDRMAARQDLTRVLAHLSTLPSKHQLAFRRWIECGMVVDTTWRKHYHGEVSRQSVRNYVGIVLTELQMEFPELVKGLPRIQPGRKVLDQWLAKRGAARYGALMEQLERTTA